ncbi:hypothetical protein MASR2M15_22410 [Anaerolineales bacterium]
MMKQSARLWLLYGMFMVLLLLGTMIFLPNLDVQAQGPQPITPGAPVVTIQPTLDKTQCLPAKFQIGEDAIVIAGVFIRAQPTVSGGQVGYTNNRQLVHITDGPVCADGYLWWKVSGVPIAGWIAQGRADIGTLMYRPDESNACRNAAPLLVNNTAETAYYVKLRAESHPDALVNTVIPPATLIDVLEGPYCDGSANWWKVRAVVVNVTYTGWIQDRVSGNIALYAPYIPSLEDGTLCQHPRPFSIGTQGFVSYKDGKAKPLRAQPGEKGALIVSLLNNVPFVVLDGPVCKDNRNWWKIRVLASTEVVGWFSEGSSGVGFWIKRAS